MTGRRELVRMEGVEKRYGRESILRVETLKIHAGDRIMLCGRNGSGKSTLLRLLAGVVPHDRGRVWFADDLRRATPGVVPQHGGLYGDLSLSDNLRLRRGVHGLGPADPLQRRYLRTLGLTSLMTKRFAELSGGYQRLAAIAAALHVDPGWLLLDEPFSGVDERHAETVLAELERIERNLQLVVLAAPTRVALPSANRWIELEEGRIR